MLVHLLRRAAVAVRSRAASRPFTTKPATPTSKTGLEKVLTPPHEHHPITEKWLLPGVLGLCASVVLGLTLAQADETPDLIDQLGDKMQVLRPRKWTLEAERFVAALARATDGNDTVKGLVGETPGLAEALVAMAVDPVAVQDLWAPVYAIRVLESAARDENAALALVVRGVEVGLVRALEDGELGVHARTAAACALANLAEHEDTRTALVKAGALRALHENKAVVTRKQAVGKACLALAHTASSLSLDSGLPADQVEAYAKECSERKSSLVSALSDPLVDAGIAMYLNTMLGGAVWGAVVAVRDGMPRAAMMRSIGRTAVITGVIPLYFVGVAVTGFNKVRRNVDTRLELATLYSVTTFSLLPWLYLLPIVEAWAPYWLGGHVVGFTSFFSYLLVTESDKLPRPAK
jgi:hypothetical protein